ncbi:MAG: ABC transporter ATP-binding protein [Firmicutes bacterium]|jgi:peptide/nickel transport system ATP-binding protein|nr:ABC transporter ATP-binding protein [Bacillota bacterium]
MQPLLSIEDFAMHYRTRAGWVQAVDGVTLTLERGQSLGLVGESGCGKTSVAMSIMRLLPYNAEVKRGRIVFNNRDVYAMREEEVRRMRWKEVSMIFQAAMNALNPVYTVGNQIVEAIVTHEPETTETQARDRVAELFDLVGIPRDRMDHYAHEYSGGMRQRAVIAMALACNPSLIIADEPTTALDVIVQDKILREMKEIRRRINMSMIYISHDVSVIAEVSDVVGVMYAGRLAEWGPADDVFKQPRHPYTFGLMMAYPSILGDKHELATIPGEPPNLVAPPPGCRFNPRCDWAIDECRETDPPLRQVETGHFIACHNPVEAPVSGGERNGGSCN